MRTCSKCGEVKAAEAFALKRSAASGRTSQCRQCIAAYNAAYTGANAAANRERARAWALANPERKAQSNRESQARRAAQHAAKNAKHRENNRALYARHEGRRRAAKTQQCLPCSREALAAIYERAALLTMVTGVPHQVDHIVPLKGRSVRGLHVPWNLQCIPQRDNARKHNKLTL